MDYSKLIKTLRIEVNKDEQESDTEDTREATQKDTQKENIKKEEVDIHRFYNERRITNLTEELRRYFDSQYFDIFKKGTGEDLFEFLLRPDAYLSYYEGDTDEEL